FLQNIYTTTKISVQLYPELVRVFKEIHDAGQLDSVVIHSNTKRREAAPVR
ncbi:MAG: hypothetical protein ACI8RD_014091, partial [Bacillariaceae sp.]